MRIYWAKMSEEQRDAVRLYDRSRKHDKHYENSILSKSSPNYHQVLYRSKKIRKLLGNDSQSHSQVLCHVLRKSLQSPSKRKSIVRQCKQVRNVLDTIPKDEYFETPHRDLNNLLQKLAIYRSNKKYKKAREIVEIINSKTKNIACTASASGNEYSHVY